MPLHNDAAPTLAGKAIAAYVDMERIPSRGAVERISLHPPWRRPSIFVHSATNETLMEGPATTKGTNITFPDVPLSGRCVA